MEQWCFGQLEWKRRRRMALNGAVVAFAVLVALLLVWWKWS